ncbi:MAG TPA: SRPBCC domain-containing protein [Candidatus Saccharimonadia bacterium]|nr:SRPBCC domain-containing protein [Candidatus Saccharimonadia bacterium]
MSQDYTTSFTTDKSPDEVFKAVTNVRGWWSADVQGNTEKLDDEFVFDVPGVHYTVQKLVEVTPGKRMVWLVTEANQTFIKQRDEWKNTKIIFDITEEDGKTKLTFTHEGLVPEAECYKFCMPSWEQYIKGSLKNLVETGEGTPNLEGKTIDKPDEV